MCERPALPHVIERQMRTVPGLVEYTSFLDSCVENQTIAVHSGYYNHDESKSKTLQCSLAGNFYARSSEDEVCCPESSFLDLDDQFGIQSCCFVSSAVDVTDASS